jgi:hypothetical protein
MLGSKLVNVTNKIILLGNMYYTLYSPNHFLVNFPNVIYSLLETT